MVNGTKVYIPAKREEWFTSLWNARQRADEFFLPYDDYIEFCFDFSSRRKRRWNMKPSQLHPSTANKDAWLNCFDKFYEDRMPHLIRRAGEIPQYRLENNLDLPAQSAFREMILKVLQDSSRPMADQIAERVHSRRHVAVSPALKLVNEDDRARVEKDALSMFEDGIWPAEPLKKVDIADLLPSCFGVLEAINVKESVCANCPMAKQCLRFGQRSLNVTEHLTGFTSPAWHIEKERNRANTANHRKRKEDALAGTGDIFSGVQ